MREEERKQRGKKLDQVVFPTPSAIEDTPKG